MRITLCLLFSLLITTTTYSQDAVLKRQLDSIMQLDQLYRSMSVEDMDAATVDSLAKANKTTPATLGNFFSFRQADIDKQNLAFIEPIIQQYGYPGKTLVGEPTNKVACM